MLIRKCSLSRLNHNGYFLTLALGSGKEGKQQVESGDNKSGGKVKIRLQALRFGRKALQVIDAGCLIVINS